MVGHFSVSAGGSSVSPSNHLAREAPQESRTSYGGSIAAHARRGVTLS